MYFYICWVLRVHSGRCLDNMGQAHKFTFSKQKIKTNGSRLLHESIVACSHYSFKCIWRIRKSRHIIAEGKKMPVYKYFGYPARFHGKPLFHIICHLKVSHQSKDCKILTCNWQAPDRSLGKDALWCEVLTKWNPHIRVSLLSTGYFGHRWSKLAQTPWEACCEDTNWYYSSLAIDGQAHIGGPGCCRKS